MTIGSLVIKPYPQYAEMQTIAEAAEAEACEAERAEHMQATAAIELPQDCPEAVGLGIAFVAVAFAVYIVVRNRSVFIF